MPDQDPYQQAYLAGILALQGPLDPNNPAYLKGCQDRAQGFGYLPLQVLSPGTLVQIPKGATLQMGSLRTFTCRKTYRVLITGSRVVPATQSDRPRLRVFWKGCADYPHATYLDACWYFDGHQMTLMGLLDPRSAKDSRPAG